ncbi:MAG: hypothetical protein LUI13_11555 [Lachnospiraceae bacterium]|nr:hypothetical protein [Lachnospiraceae bacterium]
MLKRLLSHKAVNFRRIAEITKKDTRSESKLEDERFISPISIGKST